MKNLKPYITFFILLTVFGSTPLDAQTTAVMNVKATVISGASLTQQNELNLFFNQNNSSFSAHENLFELTTAKHAEVNFDLPKFISVTNEIGETLTIHTNSSTIEDKESGTHHVALNNYLDEDELVRGRYFGEITTTIDYL